MMVAPHRSCSGTHVLALLAAAGYVPGHHDNSSLSLKQAEISTVDSRYLEIKGTLKNTSRYPDIRTSTYQICSTEEKTI